MSYKPALAVIHTSPATVELFKTLLRARVPGVVTMNLLDDSILPQLASDPRGIDSVRPRWTQMARAAKDRGVGLILNACSSIGELSAPVATEIGIPIVRVDQRMARDVASEGLDVAVVATLTTTLGPTARLLRTSIAQAGSEASVIEVMAEGAYAALMAGHPDEHDSLVRQAVIAAAAPNTQIVLAQASMARVLQSVPAAITAKCVTSPASAVEAVAEVLARVQARLQGPG